ncbi:MAG: hypothetical protein RI957_1493 [Verrucomicrobiota bacterium]|jgi:hypothetical protein
MKRPLSLLTLCCSVLLSPALGQTAPAQVTLESLHKQITTTLENEIANNKKLNPNVALQLKAMSPVWRDNQARSSIEGRLQSLKSVVNQDNISQKTREATNACITQISDLMEKQSKQMAEEIRKSTADALRRVMKATETEEIRKVISAYKEDRLKVPNGGFRDDNATPVNTTSVSEFMEHWLSFHQYRDSNQIRYAAGQITQMENLSSRVSSFLTADEVTQSLQNLRKSIGMLPPKELEVLWQQTFQELIDDANQDRLDELIQKVNKNHQMSMASNATETQASRWQWLDMLGRKLKESIQRGREGGTPNFTAEDFTRHDSSYGVVIKPEEFTSRMNRYLIRGKDGKGQEISVRLFYDVAELKAATDQLLARILDDAHQDQLVGLLEEIKRLRSYASSNRHSHAFNLSSKLERLSLLARSIKDSVTALKMGVINQLNLQQLYNDYSDGEALLSKEDLLEKLKRYQVQVPSKDGAAVKRALLVDAEELLLQAKSCSELPAILPELTRASSNSVSENGTNALTGLMPRINRCADIAQQLSSGEAFMMQTSSSSSYYIGDSSRSTPTSGPLVDRIKLLEAEVEWSALLRFFPAETSHDAKDHENRLKTLMAKFREQKNYEAMSQLHSVSQCFKASRQLLSQAQAQTIRDYLNGVRQQEVFDQPRLAVFYLQKAALSSTNLIDTQQLKNRLQSLRTQYPSDYDKGIDDALKMPTTEAFPREIEIPARAKE